MCQNAERFRMRCSKTLGSVKKINIYEFRTPRLITTLSVGPFVGLPASLPSSRYPAAKERI